MGWTSAEFPEIVDPAWIFYPTATTTVRGDDRYVLYHDGRFALQVVFDGSFEYTGRYTKSDSLITLEFSPPWGAEAVIRGDTMVVRYNDVMQHSDFVDGVYVLRR